MPRKIVASLVIAIVLLAAISSIALAGSQPQPAAPLGQGQQVVTMTPGYGMMSGTPMPGANGMAMGGSGCAMMGSMSGTTGMTGMSGMAGMSGMSGMSGTMSMGTLDDQFLLTDPATWLNNPWTMLGWLLVLVAFLAILVGIVLGVLWIVRHVQPARPAA